MTQEEIKRLVVVLKKTGDMAREASMTDAHPSTADYLIKQHARIYQRLARLDPTVRDLFEALEEGASFQVIAMACHQLAAYFERDTRGHKGSRPLESVLDFGPFKLVIGQDFEALRDLGKTFRDALKEEQRQASRRAGQNRPPNPPRAGKKGPRTPRPPHWTHAKEPWEWPFYDDGGEEDL